jgi:hypothetical protein
MKFLQSKLLAAILGSTIFAFTTAFLTTKELASTPSLESATGSSPQANIKGPSWAFFNLELDQIIGELKAERDTVAPGSAVPKPSAPRVSPKACGPPTNPLPNDDPTRRTAP